MALKSRISRVLCHYQVVNSLVLEFKKYGNIRNKKLLTEINKKKSRKWHRLRHLHMLWSVFTFVSSVII